MRSVLAAAILMLMIHGQVQAQEEANSNTKAGQDQVSPQHVTIVHYRPRVLEGLLHIGGAAYRFVSGGHGWSIPYGDWEITPETVGHWGAKHGAIGLNNDTIFDPQLDRERDGILIHETSHDATAGCVGILEHFDSLKKDIFALIDRAGEAYLHIGPTGAAITGERLSPLPPFEYIPEKEQTNTHIAKDEEPKHRSKHRTKLARHHSRHYAHHHYPRYAGG